MAEENIDEWADIKPPSEVEQIMNINDMDPWEVIKATAEGSGILIHEPNKNCKKCFGRGYVGRRHVKQYDSNGYELTDETGNVIVLLEPIACNCIFPKQQQDMGDIQFAPVNRAQRRKKK